MSNAEIKEQDELLETIDKSIKRLTAPTLLFVTSYFVWKGAGPLGVSAVAIQLTMLMLAGLLLILGNWYVSLKKIMNVESKPLYRQVAVFLHSTCYLMLAASAVAVALVKASA